MKKFLDSNILVYSVDDRNPTKRAIAMKIVGDAVGNDQAVYISTQTLMEFSNVVLKKLQMPILFVDRCVRCFSKLPTIKPDAALISRG